MYFLGRVWGLFLVETLGWAVLSPLHISQYYPPSIIPVYPHYIFINGWINRHQSEAKHVKPSTWPWTSWIPRVQREIRSFSVSLWICPIIGVYGRQYTHVYPWICHQQFLIKMDILGWSMVIAVSQLSSILRHSYRAGTSGHLRSWRRLCAGSCWPLGFAVPWSHCPGCHWPVPSKFNG